MNKNYQILSKNYSQDHWICHENLIDREIIGVFEVDSLTLDRFAQLSGDYSPIHMHNSVAKSRGFKKRIAHGVIQSSFVSALVGMEFPGENGVLQQLEMKYRKPCYPGDQLKIKLKVSEVHISVKTMISRIEVINQKGDLISRGKVQSGLQ